MPLISPFSSPAFLSAIIFRGNTVVSASHSRLTDINHGIGIRNVSFLILGGRRKPTPGLDYVSASLVRHIRSVATV